MTTKCDYCGGEISTCDGACNCDDWHVPPQPLDEDRKTTTEDAQATQSDRGGERTQSDRVANA